MAGFRGLQGRLDRLVVPYLAHEDHVGVLAHGGAQRGGEVLRVEPDLTLVDDRLTVPMEDLDGILDGEDVALAGAVDVIDDGARRGRLAGRGRAGDATVEGGDRNDRCVRRVAVIPYR